MTEERCYAEEDGCVVVFDCAVIFDAEYALDGDVRDYCKSKIRQRKEVLTP